LKKNRGVSAREKKGFFPICGGERGGNAADRVGGGVGAGGGSRTWGRRGKKTGLWEGNDSTTTGSSEKRRARGEGET